MPIFDRRKTDRIIAELARAHFRLGQLSAVSLLRPALRGQDCAAALAMADEIERAATS